MTVAPCPGCGLRPPAQPGARYDGYFNASPECWSVFTGVRAVQLASPALYGPALQFTVDAYAVQHAGGPHPDKSVDIHLAGLLLVLGRGMRPSGVPALLQRLANGDAWPHFAPPGRSGTLTIGDVAGTHAPDRHVAVARQWAGEVWRAWAPYHEEIAAFVDRGLGRRQATHARTRRS